MRRPSSSFRAVSKCILGGMLAIVVFMSSGFVPEAKAQAEAIPPTFPCGSSLGPQNECHFYDKLKEINEEVTKSFQFAVVTGILNALQFVTQRIAIDFAQWMLNGFNAQGTGFYRKTFGDYLQDLGEGAANQFISDINHFTAAEWGFNLCQPITLDLQLALGLGRISTLPPPDCTFAQIGKAFEQTYRGLEPEELNKTLLKSIQPGGNDISLAITANQKFLNKIIETREAGILNRQEGGGLKQITDIISGQIQTPAQVAKDTVRETNQINLMKGQMQVQTTSMAASALVAGLKQLPILAASTFINTLAVGALQKLFDSLRGIDDEIAQADLINPEAQGGTGAGALPVGITDILTPNLITSDKQDFTFELSTCNTPRGLWGCSMDDGLATALKTIDQNGGYTVSRAMGIGQPSGAQIFLHPDWELIPESEAKDNQDPGCYQRAYCSSNLSKLRFARIISVGWELAANSPFNKKVNGKYVTLRDVVMGYNNCNSSGQIDVEHPWCHLIDPAWVLMAPQFQCRIRGFGDTLMGVGSVQPIRVQECQDVVSCLQRNDKNECVGGYGYCLTERTAWRFGADACEEKYVSCRTYKTRDKSKVLTGSNANDTTTGPQVSYLRNSIDYGSCNQDTVGCMYYATTRDVTTTSTDKWVGGVDYTWEGTTTTVSSVKLTGKRIYLDGTAEPCDAGSDGCTKLYTVEKGNSALNLLKNASFEDVDPADSKKLIGWSTDLLGPQVKYEFVSFIAQAGSDALFGGKSAEFPSNLKEMHQLVEVAPLRNYVVSMYGRAGNGGGSPSFAVLIRLLKPWTSGNVGNIITYDADGRPFELADASASYYRSSNCTAMANNEAKLQQTGLTEEWVRKTCEFVSNPDATHALVYVWGVSAAIDGVQLEEGDAATPFIEGVNLSLPVDHLKLPPDELGCTGDTKTDRTECANYGRMCKQTDAGCQGYTDVGGGDQTEIPASLSKNDFCPFTCIGYAEYRKMPSAFDLVKTPETAYLDDPNDDTSAYFIPKSSEQCDASQAGCEEFTNVESSAAGGEEKLYVTYARACLNPTKPQNDGLAKTYFTWEGSDTTGFQLKTWSLIRKNANSPYDPVYPSPTTAPRILRKAGPDGTVKDPANCTEDAWKTGEDVDCRQIYDEQGNVFYRYFSQTIVSSPDCKDYRKNNSNLDDCTKTGGEFDQTTNQCIYHILAAESSMCGSLNAGCRGYVGTTGRNTTLAYVETFGSGSSTGIAVVPNVTSLKISPEALLVGDYSMRVEMTSNANYPNTKFKVEFGAATGSLYTVSFWAKKLASVPYKLEIKRQTSVNTQASVGSTDLTTDWKRYEIGPFLHQYGSPTGTLQFDLTGIQGNPLSSKHTYFIDEIRIQRLQDVVYVKKNSWVIPPECDQTIEGVPQPQAMLGCREYRDRKGRTADVRQFSHLCRFEVIGCTAYVDTRNSDDPYAQTFIVSGVKEPDPNNAQEKQWDVLYSGTVTTTRGGDRFTYVIDEPSARCDAGSASCRSFGRPKFTAQMLLDPNQPFETVYLKDDVSKYVDGGGEPNMLCRPNELFCERFVSVPKGTGGPVTSYFRDPQKHVCVWQDKVFLEATNDYPQGEYTGWFVKDADPATPCYPKALSRGNTFLFEYAGTPQYRGWTAACPADQAECTEYRDPNDKTDPLHPSGRPYFYIDNQRLNKGTCAGKVDPLGGCVLFRDMNNSQLPYSSKATYDRSHKEGDVAVAPVDCVTDSSNPYCQNAGTCQDLVYDSCLVSNGISFCIPYNPNSSAGQFYQNSTGKACTTDADCSYGADTDQERVRGRCLNNDSNIILKVKLDRDCTTWLGCSSGETVYDSAQGKYVDLCTNLAVCDQSLGASGKRFCGHYVPRGHATPVPKPGEGFYEPILRNGVFFDLKTYARRPTGFGVQDYSGYAIPNHFQAADLVTRRVAYDLLEERPGPQRDKYIHDYRLVAAVPLTFASESEALLTCFAWALAGNKQGYNTCQGSAFVHTDPNFPDLNLCKHISTGVVGYYVTSEYSASANPKGTCYFAIDLPYSQNVTDVLQGASNINPRNVTNIVTLFEQLTNPLLRQSLSQAYPPSECMAYPDGLSPFPNRYVKEWDLTADPPKPETYVDGYANVPYCQYGEECSCAYRKVNYGTGAAVSKYYSLFGEPPPAGVCVGGSRDGEACVPDAVAFAPGAQAPADDGDPNTTERPAEATGADASQLCGGGGSCQTIQSVSFVRGLYGQCLQRDLSRTVAGSQEFNPCMTWNPAPVLFGQNDVYHYQPTAGYLPPQNSGEYYCVMGALPPKELKTTADGTWLKFPGSTNPFHYDEDFVSDGDCFACAGNEGTFIDGSNAEGGEMGDWCEDADDQENAGNAPGGAGAAILTGGLSLLANTAHFEDGNAGRWIQTGRGGTRNYAEYFIGLNETTWMNSIFPGGLEANKTNLRMALMEKQFAFFEWSPIVNPNGRGLQGCGMTPDWVEGVSIDDYDDTDQLSEGQKTWDSYFRQNFKAIMTRDSADFMRNTQTGQPIRVPCVNGNEFSPDTGLCYYKFWEVGYRDEGQIKFQMQDAGPKKFDPASAVYFTQSKASKAFFSIRAMFESINPGDNDTDPGDLDPESPELVGPWQFVGWWVTASVPGAQTERAIYLYLTIGHADTCKEVAQVMAPDTREAAAFLDRVSEGGEFSVPLLGFTYSTVNPPFGAARHTRPIGIDPLFQVHGRMPGTLSKLKPPGFVASGVEYFRAQKYPKANWAWLSNLFARVYRVYRYYDQPVTANSNLCIAGPKSGSFCDPADPQKYCGLVGTCNEYLVDPATAPGACNALSGVNAGLPCSSNTNDDFGGYHVCHNAPMKKGPTGLLEPQYTSCELQSGWTFESGFYYPCTIGLGQPGCEGIGDANLAASQGAMRCAANAVTVNGERIKCTKPEALSKDCPIIVIGDGSDQAIDDQGRFHSGCNQETGHCTNGFEHAECTQNSHCRFTEVEYWGKYNADRPWGGITDLLAWAADPENVAYQGNKYGEWFSWDSGGDGWVDDDWESDDGDRVYYGYGSDRGGDWADEMTTAGRTWWTDMTSVHGEGFVTGDGDQAADKDIGGKNLAGGGFIRYGYTDSKDGISYLNRFPGAYAGAIVVTDDVGFSNISCLGDCDIENIPAAVRALFVPGHCERPPDTTLHTTVNPLDTIDEDDDAESQSVKRADDADRPYAEFTYFCGDDGNFSYDDGTIDGGPDCDFEQHADEPDVWFLYRRYFGGGTGGWKVGICDGGALEGSVCTSDEQCKPEGITQDEIDAANDWCKSADPDPNDPHYALCHPPGFEGDPKSNDPDKDDNLCTHNVGYYPRADLCGNDISKSQCLTAYKVKGSGNNPDLESLDPDTVGTLPPTDVTAGLFTPKYIVGDSIEQTDVDFAYTAYYNPRPPRIAAPDTGASCQAAGQCPVSLVDTFSLENRAEGTIGYVGGQAVATIKFYGWAAHNQGGLTDMWVDWGDDQVQEIHDARIKNKKPFCNVGKECQFVPGLTCNADTDCPPAGGQCAIVGFCKGRQYVTCLKDEDCTVGFIKDTCVQRIPFGNTDAACEQNYFEFTHAYACGKEMATLLPACGTTKRCSRDTTNTCSSDAGCAVGDKCLDGLAPPGGCFDEVKNACRFTPRVLLKDSWGWCSGECRKVDLGNGNLTIGPKGSEAVLHTNGGCYDFSKAVANYDVNDNGKLDDKVVSGSAANECDPTDGDGTTRRPWIVFKGALQLGIQQ